MTPDVTPTPPSPLGHLLRELLDLFVPPHCAGCETLCRETFCPACEPALEPVDGPYCPVCGHPHPPSAGGWPLCADCRPRKRPALDGARSVYFHTGPARQAVLEFKFTRRHDLARGLGAHLTRRFLSELARPHHLPFDEVTAIVPVPLHPARRAWRGFDQAGLLSRELARVTGKPCWPEVLQRVRNTPPQLRLSPAQREDNIRGAFETRKPWRLDGASLLIVDDVFTTGATLREAARALKRGGAARVYALTLTRALPTWHPRASSAPCDDA